MIDRKIVEAIKKLIAPLTQRVLLMIVRGVASTIDDTKKMQILQFSGFVDDDKDDTERFQNYGFTSHPKPGAEAIGLSLGGSSDHTIVIVVDDRRFRLTSLKEGEVAMYDDLGQKIILKRDGIEIETDSTVTIKAGMIELGENAAESVILGDTFQTIFESHFHTGNLGGNTSPPLQTMETALSQLVLTE